MKMESKKTLMIGAMYLLCSINLLAQIDIQVRTDSVKLKSNVEKLNQIDRINFIEQPAFFVRVESLINDTVTIDQANEIIENIPIKKSIRIDPDQVQILLPEIVTIYSDSVVDIDYISIIPILIRAFQDQQKIINNLQQRIDLLETPIH